jgi:integrase
VVRSLVAEAHNQSPQFGLLVELAAITGARPSQIARLQVQDLQDGWTSSGSNAAAEGCECDTLIS